MHVWSISDPIRKLPVLLMCHGNRSVVCKCVSYFFDLPEIKKGTQRGVPWIWLTQYVSSPLLLVTDCNLHDAHVPWHNPDTSVDNAGRTKKGQDTLFLPVLLVFKELYLFLHLKRTSFVSISFLNT